jgi:hypothetical protein
MRLFASADGRRTTSICAWRRASSALKKDVPLHAGQVAGGWASFVAPEPKSLGIARACVIDAEISWCSMLMEIRRTRFIGRPRKTGQARTLRTAHPWPEAGEAAAVEPSPTLCYASGKVSAGILCWASVAWFSYPIGLAASSSTADHGSLNFRSSRLSCWK